jgi:hypothetical protein
MAYERQVGKVDSIHTIDSNNPAQAIPTVYQPLGLAIDHPTVAGSSTMIIAEQPWHYSYGADGVGSHSEPIATRSSTLSPHGSCTVRRGRAPQPDSLCLRRNSVAIRGDRLDNDVPPVVTCLSCGGLPRCGIGHRTFG